MLHVLRVLCCGCISAAGYISLFVRSLVINIAIWGGFFVVIWLVWPVLTILRLDERYLAPVTNLIHDIALAIVRVAGRVTITMHGKLPRGACIIMPTHQSVIDTIFIWRLIGGRSYVLKKEVGWMFWCPTKAVSIIVANRESRSAFVATQRLIKEVIGIGRSVVIYPEASRKPFGKPIKLVPGVAILYASKAADAFVPVYVNTGYFWPPRSFLRRPCNIVVDILQPIYLDEGLGAREFLRRLEDVLNEARIKHGDVIPD